MNRILTFESVHHALKAEKAIRKAGITADVISTPRRFSNDCGIALRFSDAVESGVLEVLLAQDIVYRGLYGYED